jgi:hypothetical protein
MYNVAEQISTTNKAGVDTFMTLASATFAGAERLAALNLNAARNFIENGSANTRALLAVKDVEALVTLQKSLRNPMPKKRRRTPAGFTKSPPRPRKLCRRWSKPRFPNSTRSSLWRLTKPSSPRRPARTWR